jgi:Rho termination factor, N-terminal domain.
MANKQATIKITSAIGIDGKIKKPGTIITVDEDVAKNLLQRGRAVLDTAEGIEDKQGDLTKLSVAELKEYAKHLDIDGADGMKKAELIGAIEAAEAE